MADRTQDVEPTPTQEPQGHRLSHRRCRWCDVPLHADDPALCGRCAALDALAEMLDDIDLGQMPAAQHMVSWLWRTADVVAIEGFRDLIVLLGGRPRH